MLSPADKSSLEHVVFTDRLFFKVGFLRIPETTWFLERVTKIRDFCFEPFAYVVDSCEQELKFSHRSCALLVMAPVSDKNIYRYIN